MTTTERVAALRARAAALGLKRREIYAHPEDWVAINALAARLQKRREKAAKVTANAELKGGASAPSALSAVLGAANDGETE